MLRRRGPIEAPNRVRLTDPPSGGLASSVRRPLRIQFEPPADPSAWHMTGRFNWPCPHQSFGIVPSCEWANDEGMRIWLPAQHKDLVAEFTYRVEGRWRKLAMRSWKLLASIAASFRRQPSPSPTRTHRRVPWCGAGSSAPIGSPSSLPGSGGHGPAIEGPRKCPTSATTRCSQS